MSNLSVTCRPFAPHDLDSLLALHHRVFHENRTREQWEWKFLGNPDGEAIIMVAEAGQEIIGHYGLIPRTFFAAGHQLTAYQEVDLIIDRSARQPGLFRTLGMMAYRAAVQRGAPFTYGYPNTRSTPVGVQKLGWEPVAPIHLLSRYAAMEQLAYTGLRPVARAIQCSLDRWISWRNRLDNRPAVKPLDLERQTDAIFWEDYTRGQQIIMRRSPDYLKWRYARSPAREYEAFFVDSATGPRGVAIARVVQEKTMVLWLLELTARDPAAWHSLIDHCCSMCRERNIPVMKSWQLGPTDERRQLARHGFIRRRAPVFQVVRPLGSKAVMDLLRSPARWYVTLGDADGI